MMSREELEKHLSVLRTEEILRLLRDDTLLELANTYFASLGMRSKQNEAKDASMDTSPSSFMNQQSGEPSPDKAKRPLNAFMAFRSYYLRLFPEVQQKTASGFLTTLWNKDPFRNKWALIAKVYSFARDQLGRDKVSLSYFLNVSCPIMKIIEPSIYLSAFGWSVEDETGTPKLLQSGSSIQVIDSDDYPNTENDLLAAIVNVGYLPDDSINLMERMNANSSGIMTTATTAATATKTTEKTDFMKVIESDPFQAAKELLGTHYEEKRVPVLGVKSHLVDDLNVVNHLPLQFAYPDPRQLYNYAYTSPTATATATATQQYQTEMPQMGYFGMTESDTIDVDNPWDIDKMMGYQENEGERDTGLPPNNQYNPNNEFYYTF
ncbi:mating-type protein MAT-1 [Trichoderma harzianum]|uniref:Mating-type protein MAT-1 n=1 Tax=Trichoderma harzianum TaxID=5544 RepID=A0A0F9X8E6_TRIHA|nr:mating-type protein MAT-1 [Trichoderma harzianum]